MDICIQVVESSTKKTVMYQLYQNKTRHLRVFCLNARAVMHMHDSQRVLIVQTVWVMGEVSSKFPVAMRSQLMNMVKYLDNDECSMLICIQWLVSHKCHVYNTELKKKLQWCTEVEATSRLLVPVSPSLSPLSGYGISKRDKTLAKALLSVECWKRNILQHREGHCIMQINNQSTNTNMCSTHRNTQAQSCYHSLALGVNFFFLLIYFISKCSFLPSLTLMYFPCTSN